MNTKLAKYIDEECKKRNLSTKEYAEKCTLSESYIRQIRRNDFKSLTMDTLQLLAQGFDLPLTFFLEEAGYTSIIPTYMLDMPASLDLINAIKVFAKKCNIDIDNLNNDEIMELANYIMITVKLVSYKYTK